MRVILSSLKKSREHIRIRVLAALMMFLFVLPMSPMRAAPGNQEKPLPEAAKSAASTENQEKPSFEVISIKRRYSKSNRYGTSFQPGGRFVSTNYTLRGLISVAYEIPLLRVLGGPSLVDTIHWDVQAKPEEGKYPLKNGILDPHLGNLMVQSMLEDRFKVKTHRETRILPGYEITIAKGGPLLKKAGLQPGGQPKRGFSVGNWDGELALRNGNLIMLSQILAMQLNCEVVDKTGITGFYDMVIKWTPKGGKPSIAASSAATTVDPEITIFDAIQDQLGLKLVTANLPTQVLIIDHAQMPEPN